MGQIRRAASSTPRYALDTLFPIYTISFVYMIMLRKYIKFLGNLGEEQGQDLCYKYNITGIARMVILACVLPPYLYISILDMVTYS